LRQLGSDQDCQRLVDFGTTLIEHLKIYNFNKNDKKIGLLCPYLILIILILLGSGFLFGSYAQAIPGKGTPSVSAGLNSPSRQINSSGTSVSKQRDQHPSKDDSKRGYPIYSYVNKKVAGFLGKWVNQPVFYDITWYHLFFCLFLLILVFLCERLLHALNRVLVSSVARPGISLNWLEILGLSLIRPLSLLVWIFGGYGAFYPILIHYPLVKDIALRIAGAVGIIAIIWLIFRFMGLLDLRLRDRAATTGSTADSLLASLVSASRWALPLLIGIILIRLAFSFLSLPSGFLPILNYVWGIAIIASIAWLIIRATDIPVVLITSHYNIKAKDNLEARKIHTQIRFFGKLIKITVIVLALAFMLMMFPAVRHFGVSILASAGVMGIIAGLAAQRSIANILVGIQITITQPFRVDDVVVIEGEWGWIEEITATYVVVRIWDLRRLIIPIVYFTEKSFQNWTRTSANILGTVYLYVDYSMPVEVIRRELHRILKNSDSWDGQAWGLQVTDTTEHTIQLRALMSAADSPTAWNLRCEVREKLIGYLQENYPTALPKIRGELKEPEPK
jgi:small-conductance mechanosensitive channel